MGYFANKATGNTKEIVNKIKSSGGLTGILSSSSTKKTSGSSSSSSSNKTSSSSSNKTSSSSSNKTNSSNRLVNAVQNFLSDYLSNPTSSNAVSNSNSTYNPYSGIGYDVNTDYQAIINDAVAKSDYKTAALAEQARNAKIVGTGSKLATTNKYGGYLTPDYGTIGQNQMASGANWEDVLSTYNSRYNKAMTTEGLQQYSNDAIQQQMWQYIQDNMRYSSQADAQAMLNQWLSEYERNNPQPEYTSQYDAQIDALLNQILNREDFSYDVMNDPLYQQYAQMYQREGDRAMKETLAEAAAGAGGMNSYAVTAASQANNYYNSQLNDKIPELYQLAYSMFLNDKESQVQNLGLLQNMDATQYSRYRDTMNDYYNDKSFAYGAYMDAINQGNIDRDFNYNSTLAYQDYLNNNIWNNREWNEKQADKEFENNRYDQSTAKDEVWKYISLGVMPSAELIAQAGMTETDVRLAVEAVKAENAPKSTTSTSTGSSSSGYSGGNNTITESKVSIGDAGDTGSAQDNFVRVSNGIKELVANGESEEAKKLINDAVKTGLVSETIGHTLMIMYKLVS